MGTPHRAERLQKEILREVSLILLHGLNDPRVSGITLTRVKLAPDLRTARVFGLAHGGAHGWRRAAAALSCARGHIQNVLGARLSIRHTPEIAFVRDEEAEAATRVEELFHVIDQERKRRTAEDPGPAGDPPVEHL